MKKKLLIIGFFIIIGIAIFLVNRFRNKPEEGVLVLSGNVEVIEVNIGFKIPGRVVELLTDEGQKVKKGERLAVLDSAHRATLKLDIMLNHRMKYRTCSTGERLLQQSR